MNQTRIVLALVGLAAAAPLASADPVTLSFFNITNNSGTTDVSDQLACVVSDAGFFDGAWHVTFRFTNNVGDPCTITEVYFDDGTLLGISHIDSSSGVNFSQGAAPPNLPGGENLDPDFETTAGFLADADNPGPHNGVNDASDWLDITFALINGQDFDDTLAALADGRIRIGLHITAFAGGGSDSYVNNPLQLTTIPLPTSAGLAAAGLALIAPRRRRGALRLG